jgi:hypothetical protein
MGFQPLAAGPTIACAGTMNRIVLLGLTLTASVAHAEGRDPVGEPNGYAAVGGITGEDHFEFHGIAGEVGRRLGPTRLFGRVMATAGNTSLPNTAGRGTYAEGRAGVEGRTCSSSGVLCGSLGLDLGIHRSRYKHVDLSNPTGFEKAGASVEDPLEERFDTVVAVPRLTIDGGARVRVRGVFELPQHLHEDGSVTGFAVSLSIGVGF